MFRSYSLFKCLKYEVHIRNSLSLTDKDCLNNRNQFHNINESEPINMPTCFALKIRTTYNFKANYLETDYVEYLILILTSVCTKIH